MDTFTIVVLNGALASSVAITLDILRTANQVAKSISRPTLTWKLVGSTSLVQMNNGMYLEVMPLQDAQIHKNSILIVPGLGLETSRYIDQFGCYSETIQQSYSPATLLEERLSHDDVLLLSKLAYKHYVEGGVIAASCSAVLTLGSSGLLDGRSVTTHWGLYDLLKTLHPDCMLDTLRMLVQDGRLITAGAAMSQMDLMLLLLKTSYGHEISELTRRYLLIDGRLAESHYMAIADLKIECKDVLELERLVEKHMPNIPSLKTIAEKLLVTEKTLARRVRKSTGLAPSTFIQRVRFRHAESLLRTTNFTIDEIATKVGYTDATALRRLTIKNIGCTPSQLRNELKLLV